MKQSPVASSEKSGGRLLRDWGRGHEIVAEAGDVGTQEFRDAFGLGGAQDEAGVMFFSDALDDFGIAVSAGVWSFHTRKGDYHTSVFAAAFR